MGVCICQNSVNCVLKVKHLIKCKKKKAPTYEHTQKKCIKTITPSLRQGVGT